MTPALCSPLRNPKILFDYALLFLTEAQRRSSGAASRSEAVAWNCLLGLSGLILRAASLWALQALPRLSALNGPMDATNDVSALLAAEKPQESF